jgi:hypothetical protein
MYRKGKNIRSEIERRKRELEKSRWVHKEERLIQMA